jgi:hypothetical protein
MSSTHIKLPKPCQCREWLGVIVPSRQVICVSCGVAGRVRKFFAQSRGKSPATPA